MAKTSMKIKQSKKAKFSTQEYKEENFNGNERSSCRYAYKNP